MNRNREIHQIKKTLSPTCSRTTPLFSLYPPRGGGGACNTISSLWPAAQRAKAANKRHYCTASIFNREDGSFLKADQINKRLPGFISVKTLLSLCSENFKSEITNSFVRMLVGISEALWGLKYAFRSSDNFINSFVKRQKIRRELLFKQAVELVERKEHLTPEGLQKIVSIRAALNKGLSEDLRAYPDVVPSMRPQVQNIIIPENAPY